jgi:SAM-dependent methyltransferase
MRFPRASACVLLTAVLALVAAPAMAQGKAPFQPEEGQPGKDVVWVPTPPALVEKMLDLARVGPNDFVIDLGSGDGRNIIAAARRGARALGIEYNPDMVDLSRRMAAAAGVAERARFERGDMFTADISRATVMALFLLPSNLLQLRSKFLALAPGSRVVSNTFLIEGWTPDASESIGGGCEMWCEAHLWIVPAPVAGRWQLPDGELTLTQAFQQVSGTFAAAGTTIPLTGRLRGAELELSGSGMAWHGRVRDGALELTRGAGPSITARRSAQ